MATSESATATLPRHMSIKGDNGKYLAVKSDGLLTFDADQKSFLTCHEVIYNFDNPEGTFSIRAPNGRFWRRDADNWIRADGSTEPPAVTNLRTRFKLVRFGSSGRLGFLSALDGRHLNRLNRPPLHGYNALTFQPDEWSQVEVSDGSEHAIHLPRSITFKGDNNHFLLVRKESNNENWWLQFGGGENDLSRDEAINNVVQMVDGSLAFYNIHRQAYWRNRALDSNSWVWAEFEGAAEGDPRCHFWPIRLSDQMLALTSKSNNKICKRFTNYWTSCLAARATGTNDVTTRLTVSEATLSRSVFNVKYLLKLASSTDQRLLMVGEGYVVNNRDEPADMTVTVTVLQNLSQHRTFSRSVTITQKISTEFTAGIPGIAANKTSIEIGAQQNFSKAWGDTTQEGVQFQTQYLVRNVKPRMTGRATVFATTARMRVPFTYTSRERAANGIDRPSENHVDGVFDGVTAFAIHAILDDGDSKTEVPLILANGIYGKED